MRYALAALFMFLPLVANGGEALTIRWLITMCTSKDGNDQAVCNAYLRGMLDGQAVQRQVIPGSQFLCRPKQGLTTSEALLPLLSWAEEHPDEWGGGLGTKAMVALAHSYGCRQ